MDLKVSLIKRCRFPVCLSGRKFCHLMLPAVKSTQGEGRRHKKVPIHLLFWNRGTIWTPPAILLVWQTEMWIYVCTDQVCLPINRWGSPRHRYRVPLFDNPLQTSLISPSPATHSPSDSLTQEFLCEHTSSGLCKFYKQRLTCVKTNVIWHFIVVAVSRTCPVRHWIDIPDEKYEKFSILWGGNHMGVAKAHLQQIAPKKGWKSTRALTVQRD